MKVRPFKTEDWDQVREIYALGLETKNASFEQEAPDWISWDRDHLQPCRIVAEIDTGVVGWAALKPVSKRKVYLGVCEVSVYVHPRYRGRRIGDTLMRTLVSESEAAGRWTLQASIFPENMASIKLHERYNFRRVGFRERIGMLDGVWRDTILFERRSSKVGV